MKYHKAWKEAVLTQATPWMKLEDLIYTKGNKPDTKRQSLYESAYTRSLERPHSWRDVDRWLPGAGGGPRRAVLNRLSCSLGRRERSGDEGGHGCTIM